MLTVPKSSEEVDNSKMVNDILSGSGKHQKKNLSPVNFNKFLNEFLLEETSCKESKQEYGLFDPNCLIHNGKPIFKPMFLDYFIKNDSFKHIWNFCSEFLVLQKKNISEETLKKLLELQSDFTVLYSKKNFNISYIFTKNDSKTINSYYAFVKEFLQIPNFRQTKIQHFSGQEAFNHAKLLLKSFIRFAPNQSQILSDLNSTSRYPYDIESPFQNFMSGSGKLALQLRSKNESFNFLEVAAKELTNVATGKLNSTALSRIKFNFVSEYHKEDSNIEEICQQVFNTADSHPSALKNTHFTLIYKMLTSIGLGAFSGFLNGGSQIILHIAEQKNCSLPTQRLLAVTLALANSLTISTLPLIYSIVENFANDETDSLVNSEKLLTCTYAFITSIILQGINAGVQCALPKKPLLKNLLSMLPLFTGLWVLANSDDSILEYISVLAANIITALATSSSLTYFGLKRLPGNRSNDLVEKSNENKGVELKPFNTENDDKPTARVIVESKDIGNIKKTYLYITNKKFDEIKENSQKVIKLLEELVSALNENIEKTRAQINHDTIPDVANMYQKIIDNKTKVLEIIQLELKIKSKISFLHEDHEKACQKYIIGSKHTETEEAEIKNAYISAMDKLGNVFKLLNPVFRNLELQLNKAKGYVEAAQASFANNDKTLDNLNDLLKALDTPFTEIKLYLNIYSTWNAGVQGKEEGVKEGAKRALANKENFEKSIQSAAPQITSRPKKTRSFLNIRPQSVASDSRIHSSGSEEGSVISTGSSKDAENAFILRPLLKSSR